MEFFASNQLAKILVQNGFVEKTKSIYPKHFEEMKLEEYNPDKFKRYFKFGRNVTFIFDYINLKVDVRWLSSIGGISLSERELKSVLTFVKLPYNSKEVLYKKLKNISDLAGYYERICENPQWHKGETDQRIKSIFENISFREHLVK